MDAGISVAASIGISSDDLREHGDRLVHALGGSHHPRPLYSARNGTAVSNGTDVLTIDAGFPPIGSMWKATHISLFGSDATTVVLNNSNTALTGAVYLGDPGAPSLTQVAVPGLKFPDFYEFQTPLVVLPNQNIFLTTGQPCATGQQIGFVVRFEEWKLSDVLRTKGE